MQKAVTSTRSVHGLPIFVSSRMTTIYVYHTNRNTFEQKKKHFNNCYAGSSGVNQDTRFLPTSLSVPVSF